MKENKKDEFMFFENLSWNSVCHRLINRIQLTLISLVGVVASSY